MGVNSHYAEQQRMNRNRREANWGGFRAREPFFHPDGMNTDHPHYKTIQENRRALVRNLLNNEFFLERKGGIKIKNQLLEDLGEYATDYPKYLEYLERVLDEMDEYKNQIGGRPLTLEESRPFFEKCKFTSSLYVFIDNIDSIGTYYSRYHSIKMRDDSQK